MKIITWNCQGAFRKKADVILLDTPDILIIQECNYPDFLKIGTDMQTASDFLWFGDCNSKGMGIFSFGKYKLRLLQEYDSNIKFIAPISVYGGDIDFILFAIWANNRQDKSNQYIEQVWQAVNHYENLLENENVILAGDLNSNKMWDKKHKRGNHSDVVLKLHNRNIESVYHKQFNQEQGQEDQATFFMQRNPNKPYHIDYCFASKALLEKLAYFEVGNCDKWIALSDHMPLMTVFKTD